MTGKRFTTKNIICSNYCIWDNNDKPYGNDEVVELLNELNDENTELKHVLMKVLNQLYNAESNLIYEYSTSIAEDEKQLEIEFKEKYGKYGWGE